MTTGLWLAMFPRERTPALDEVVRRIGEWRGTAARMEDDHTIVVTVSDSLTRKTIEVTIGLNASPSVLEESAEIATDPRAPAAQREALTRADTRFEIAWDLGDSEAAFHTLLFVSDLFRELAGAVIFDTTGGGFV